MGRHRYDIKKHGPLERLHPAPKVVLVVLKPAGGEQMFYIGYLTLETAERVFVAQRKLTKGKTHFYGYIHDIPKERIEKYTVLYEEKEEKAAEGGMEKTEDTGGRTGAEFICRLANEVGVDKWKNKGGEDAL